MTYLSNERKKDMIGQRLAQCEAEKYQHEINLKIAQSLEKEDEIAQAQNAIAILEKSIEVYNLELQILNVIEDELSPATEESLPGKE